VTHISFHQSTISSSQHGLNILFCHSLFIFTKIQSSIFNLQYSIFNIPTFQFKPPRFPTGVDDPNPTHNLSFSLSHFFSFPNWWLQFSGFLNFDKG
jgi:hypothetical protein